MDVAIQYSKYFSTTSNVQEVTISRSKGAVEFLPFVSQQWGSI